VSLACPISSDELINAKRSEESLFLSPPLPPSDRAKLTQRQSSIVDCVKDHSNILVPRPAMTWPCALMTYNLVRASVASVSQSKRCVSPCTAAWWCPMHSCVCPLNLYTYMNLSIYTYMHICIYLCMYIYKWIHIIINLYTCV